MLNRPSHYSSLKLVSAFTPHTVKWYPGEKAELKTFFNGPELPFQFGYAQHGGLGVLLAAWRAEME